MNKIITTALCSVCCCITAAQRTYSLEQLRDSALHNNVAVRSARYSIDAARHQRREALTKYFPTVSANGLWFNANKGMAQTTVTPSQVVPEALGTTLSLMLPAEALASLADPVSVSMMKNGTVAGITAVQPVFAGGQIVNGNRLAKVGEDVSRLQLQLSENEVERNTEQYYWQVVSLEEKLKTVAAVDTLLSDIRKDVEIAVRAGLAMRNDLLQVQLRQNEMESQRLKLQNGIKACSSNGNVNGDEDVTVADITSLVNIVKNPASQPEKAGVADVNDDNNVTVDDVAALANIILGKDIEGAMRAIKTDDAIGISYGFGGSSKKPARARKM